MAAPKVDILVNLLTALQPFASGATTLPLNDADHALDYSRLIGTRVIDHENRLSQLTSSLNTLYGYVTTLQTQMATIIANGLTVPQISLPGIMPDSAYYNVEVVVSTIGNQFVILRNATGNSSELTNAVNSQNVIYTPNQLKLQTSFTDTSSTMSQLDGWIGTPRTIADTITNMWITINDMRKAYQTKFATPIITGCDEITIGFSLYRDIPNNRITLFFLGNSTIPDGFIDTDSKGAKLIITDQLSNTYTTYVNVTQANKSIDGVIIDLSGTNINIYTTLSLVLTYSITNGSLTCPGTYSPTLTTTTTPCVGLTLTPLSTTSFTGIFSPIIGKNVNYTINTYSNPDCSALVPGSTQLFNNPTQQQLTYTVTSGLSTNTTYYVRMTTQIGALASVNCIVQTVKTLS